jgi:molybdopterin-guanine dinucleotide biosynthesis protein A
MAKTALILAGGFSERFGQDKGLVMMAGKPLLLHVLDRVGEAVEEVIVVVSSPRRREAYSSALPKGTRILVDIEDSQSPLVGALTGFVDARGDYSVLLPCDTPFISGEVIDLLLETSQGMEAAVPRWPNGYIEPLQAAYRTNSALEAAEAAVKMGETRLLCRISRLRRVRYVSTEVIKKIDPGLVTFFNVNTPMDLKKAERLVRGNVRSLEV